MHHKSWSALNQQLSQFLCDTLKGKITYSLTRYHKVHNSYGKASILYQKKVIVNFTWNQGQNQESYLSDQVKENPSLSYRQILDQTSDETLYSENLISENDFLDQVQTFLNQSIDDSIRSTKIIILILAIMDRRVGQRTLANQEILANPLFQNLLVNQVYQLRIHTTLE